MIARLTESITDVCPIHGIQGGTQATATIDFKPEATAEQRAAAEAALAAFDWSDAAQSTWERQKRRDAAVAMIRSKEPAMIVVRALATVVKRRVSLLLVALGQTPLTTEQLEEMMADVIADGEVDEFMPPNGG